MIVKPPPWVLTRKNMCTCNLLQAKRENESSAHAWKCPVSWHHLTKYQLLKWLFGFVPHTQQPWGLQPHYPLIQFHSTATHAAHCKRALDAPLMCLTGKLILHDRPASEKETEIFWGKKMQLYSNDSFDSVSLKALSENTTIQTAALVFFMCCSFLASL